MIKHSRGITTAIAVACCVIIGQVTSAKQPISTYANIIDSNDVEFIAEVLCEPNKGNEYQIAELATINKLFGFFDNLPETHDMFQPCREMHMNKLRELNELIELGETRDICGQESIDELLKFHRKYISQAWQERSSSLARQLPQLLKLFFIHYLYEVSLTCKQGLIKKLDSPEAIEKSLKIVKQSAEELRELDRLNERFSVMVGGKSGSLSKFYDIVMVWSQLDRSFLGPDVGVFSEPSRSNNYQRVSIVSPEAYKFIRVQQECKELKPLYESPLLAVVRLIDFGYYLNDEPFADHLLNRPNLRRLIGLVIICEVMTPVGVIQDDAMKPGTHLLLSNDEAKAYKTGSDPTEVVVKQHQELSEFNIKPRNFRLPSPIMSHVTPATANEVVEKVMDNLRDREKFVKRVLRSYMGRWKLKIKSIFSKIFFLSSLKDRDLFPTDVLPLFEMMS